MGIAAHCCALLRIVAHRFIRRLRSCDVADVTELNDSLQALAGRLNDILERL